jgi:hypothetical protein
MTLNEMTITFELRSSASSIAVRQPLRQAKRRQGSSGRDRARCAVGWHSSSPFQADQHRYVLRCGRTAGLGLAGSVVPAYALPKRKPEVASTCPKA